MFEPDETRCRLCGGTPETLFEVGDENRRVTEERFTYAKCTSCSAILLLDPPADLARYYQADYYEIPPLQKLRALARKDSNKIETVLKLVRGGRLLEVGPAFGTFAWQAKEAGFVVDVIEMDTRCCEYLRRDIGVNVIESDAPDDAIEALPKHDVIAMWHVLEHLSEPLLVLRAAVANLNEGGVLVIAVPNPQAFQFGLMGKHWPHIDAPRHLTLLPARALSEKLKELGLETTHLSCDDRDARRWNRFGWQRLLMNRCSGKFAHRISFLVGYALSVIMTPLDRRNFNGCAYTGVFRKPPLR